MRDQGPTTREGGERIACGVSKPITTVRRDWVLLILRWTFAATVVLTVVFAVRFFV